MRERQGAARVTLMVARRAAAARERRAGRRRPGGVRPGAAAAEKPVCCSSAPCVLEVSYATLPLLQQPCVEHQVQGAGQATPVPCSWKRAVRTGLGGAAVATKQPNCRQPALPTRPACLRPRLHAPQSRGRHAGAHEGVTAAARSGPAWVVRPFHVLSAWCCCCHQAIKLQAARASH